MDAIEASRRPCQVHHTSYLLPPPLVARLMSSDKAEEKDVADTLASLTIEAKSTPQDPPPAVDSAAIKAPEPEASTAETKDDKTKTKVAEPETTAEAASGEDGSSTEAKAEADASATTSPAASPSAAKEKKQPYVNPERFKTGGAQRVSRLCSNSREFYLLYLQDKMSPEELVERMNEIRLKNEKLKERRAVHNPSLSALSSVPDYVNWRTSRQSRPTSRHSKSCSRPTSRSSARTARCRRRSTAAAKRTHAGRWRRWVDESGIARRRRKEWGEVLAVQVREKRATPRRQRRQRRTLQHRRLRRNISNRGCQLRNLPTPRSTSALGLSLTILCKLTCETLFLPLALSISTKNS